MSNQEEEGQGKSSPRVGASLPDSSTSAIKERIEREISVLKSRITFKAEEVAKLEQVIEDLKRKNSVAAGKKELSKQARLRVGDLLRKRAQSLESDIQMVEKITLSTTNAKKCCHVPVYYSKTGFRIVVVSPGITCATLVRQVLALFFTDDPQTLPFEKYVKMRRRGVKDSLITEEMRKDKVRVPPWFFQPAEHTLVFNKGRKPGLWEEEDLNSAKNRDQEAIPFLTSLSFDVQRGCGVNGGKIVPVARNAPNLLPPLYLVKNPQAIYASGVTAASLDEVNQVSNEHPAIIAAPRPVTEDSHASPGSLSPNSFSHLPNIEELGGMAPRTSLVDSVASVPDVSDRRGSQTDTQPRTSMADSVPPLPEAPSFHTELAKVLAPKRGSVGSYFSLGDDAHREAASKTSVDRPHSDRHSHVLAIRGQSATGKDDEDANTADGDEDTEEDGRVSQTKSIWNKCRSWCMPKKINVALARYSSSQKRLGKRYESSAFEAFAALILLGDIEDDDDKDIPTTPQPGANNAADARMFARKQRILNKAADLMDFAWLGRKSSVARLYCRHLGTALGLDRPPRSLWAVIFKDIAQGSGDRLAHSVGFDEFHSQYMVLRNWEFPGEEGMTYGAKIDELVNGLKADMKSTYKLVNVSVPLYVWNRRARAVLFVVAFVLLVVASLDNAWAFVEVASSFPASFDPRFNFTEYYLWSTGLCGRLIRSDISSIVARQQRIQAIRAADCPDTGLFPEFANSAQQTNVSAIRGTEWGQFENSIFQATSAHGRFADYNAAGFPLVQGGGNDYAACSSGLDVSTRAVIVDFEVVNTALNVGAHGEYVTEFDSSGATVSRLSMNSKTSVESLPADSFTLYAIISSVFLGCAFLVAILPLCLWRRNKKSSGMSFASTGLNSVATASTSQSLGVESRGQFFFVSTISSVIAFATTLPLVFTNYNSNLLAVATITTALALALVLCGLERSWSWVLQVFDNARLRLFSIFVQYVLLIVCYGVAVEGWYGEHAYVAYHYGQTALAVSVMGIVQNYDYLLFSSAQGSFGDFVSVLFGIFFIMLSTTLIFTFFAVVIVGFRDHDDQPNWGLFSLRSRKMYRPVMN